MAFLPLKVIYIIMTFAYSNDLDYLRHVLKEALALSKLGHEIVIITSTRNTKRKKIDNLNIYFLDKGHSFLYFVTTLLFSIDLLPLLICAIGFRNTFGIVRYASNVIKMILPFKKKNDNIMVVHSNFAYPEGVIGYILCRFLKIPHIVSLRGRDIVINYKTGYGLRLNRFLNRLIRKTLSATDSIIIINKNFIKELDSFKIDMTKVFFVPHGIDINVFNPNIDGKYIRAKLKIPSECFVIVSMSHIRPIKGLDLLIEAGSILKKWNEKFKILICGRDLGYLRELQKKVINYKLEEDVIFLGEINRVEVPYYLAAADAVASLMFVGGFSIDAIEALACGKPVIAARSEGVSELIKNNYNGILVDPTNPHELAEKILFLMRNPSHCKEMGLRGRILVEKSFSLDNEVKKILKTYIYALKHFTKR